MILLLRDMIAYSALTVPWHFPMLGSKGFMRSVQWLNDPYTIFKLMGAEDLCRHGSFLEANGLQCILEQFNLVSVVNFWRDISYQPGLNDEAS